MKNFFLSFFTILGIIFFCLLLVLAYLWLVDPFAIRPLISSYQQNTSESVSLEDSQSGGVEGEATPTDPADKNPNLTAAQEDALELVGVNPAALPSEITEEQMLCFERVLGKERVAAIMAGEAPSVVEILKANECL